MPLPPPTMTVEQAEQIISLYMDVYVKNALRLIELQRAVEVRAGDIKEQE